ncbi:MAG: hypothetical protein ACI9GB_003924, partial [Halioglobus sp.]
MPTSLAKKRHYKFTATQQQTDSATLLTLPFEPTYSGPDQRRLGPQA